MKPDPIQELADSAETHIEKSLRARRHGDHILETLHARDARDALLAADTLLTLHLLRDLRTARCLQTLFSLLLLAALVLILLDPGTTDRIALAAAAVAAVALRHASRRLADRITRTLADDPLAGLQTVTPEKTTRSDPPATI